MGVVGVVCSCSTWCKMWIVVWSDIIISCFNIPHQNQLELQVTHCSSDQGILTNRYTQREFKLKFSALLKVYDIKFAENSKNITL